MDPFAPPLPASGRGLLATWVQATFRPGALFSLPADHRSDWSPLLFAFVMGAIGIAIGGFLDVLLAGATLQRAALIGAGAAVTSLVTTALWVFVSGGLAQLVLVIVSSRKQPWRETRDCFCFAQAPSIFVAVPFVGSLVASVWQIVVLSIGLKRVHSTTTPRAVLAALSPLLCLVALAVGLRTSVIEAFRIPSGAMLPTIEVGDHIFINKLVYRFSAPRRGDVIVFRYPEDPDKDFIKRAVAIGGDTIEIRRNFLYVNGQKAPRSFEGTVSYPDLVEGNVEETLADEWTETLDGHRFSIYLNAGSHSNGCPPPARFGCGEATRIPDGAVFVMGDNRDNSHDSRFWGFVPMRYIKGRAMFIWYSEGPGGPRWSRLGRRIQ